jgi:hypothetical protein
MIGSGVMARLRCDGHEAYGQAVNKESDSQEVDCKEAGCQKRHDKEDHKA